jgi:dephospho-CoA kinase
MTSKQIKSHGQLIAITGGIGSGKSFVLKCFKRLGFIVYSFDAATASLYKEEGAAYDLIKKEFPSCIEGICINKKLLGAIVFADKAKLKRLEEIIHPLLREHFQSFVERIRKTNNRSIVVEVPLLFETANTTQFDIIISTIADPNLQRKRALTRKDMTLEKFDAIVARQVQNDYRAQHSDFLIDTRFNQAHSFKQIKILFYGKYKRNCFRHRNHRP